MIRLPIPEGQPAATEIATMELSLPPPYICGIQHQAPAAPGPTQSSAEILSPSVRAVLFHASGFTDRSINSVAYISARTPMLPEEGLKYLLCRRFHPRLAELSHYRSDQLLDQPLQVIPRSARISYACATLRLIEGHFQIAGTRHVF